MNKMKKPIFFAMCLAIISVISLIPLSFASIAISSSANVHRVFDLIELGPKQKHPLLPSQESILNIYVRNVTNDTDTNKNLVEWCVATTSNEAPQWYSIRLVSPRSRPFVNAYSNPDARYEQDGGADKLSLSSNKLTATANFQTWNGRDGFCAVTKEPKGIPFSQIMKLEVWTNVTKVGKDSVWQEYSILAGGDDSAVCEATAEAQNEKGETGVYKCKLENFRVSLNP